MSMNDITSFPNPHLSLVNSNIKIGDHVMYSGEGWLRDVVLKVDSYDTRNNGNIIAISKNPYINFCAPIENFIKVQIPQKNE